jgi:tRNA dimethylallyltransferase
MLEAGMWQEIEKMHAMYNDEVAAGRPVDLNTGIWQSIGFKEFLAYLQARELGTAATEEDRHAGIESVKTATRQYARTQVRWVRIKLMNALFAAVGDGVGEDGRDLLYLLDSTNINRYDDNVMTPARTITSDFLAGRYKRLPDPTSLSELAKECLAPKRDFDLSKRPDLWVQNTCETCGIVATNVIEWETHIKSSSHKRKVASARKRIEVMEFLRNRKEQEQIKDSEPNDVVTVSLAK